MTSGGIKRFGGLGALATDEVSSPGLRVFDIMEGRARLGNKMLVRFMELSGIRGGSMDVCNDFRGDVSYDLVELGVCQYAIE